jgi:hypothetical protein
MRSLTGHDSYLMLANGTMALAAAIAAVCEDSKEVELPALGCWTLTRAALDSDATVTYHDVNERLQSVGVAADRPHVLVAPWWGGMGDPTVGPRTVVDLSVNCAPVSSPPGAACVISMGPGKPAAHPRHGGVLAFSDPEIGRRIDHVMSMTDERGRWASLGPRLTGCAISEHEVEGHFQRLLDSSDARRDAAESATVRLREVCSALEPVWPVPTGCSFFIPFLLPGSMALHARDIARLAAAWRVPLGTQPVSPAYLEPATAGTSSVTRPHGSFTAETVARRLVFMPSSALRDESPVLARIARFMHWLQERLPSYGPS